MKKPTTLSLLKEIRDIVLAIHQKSPIVNSSKNHKQPIVNQNYFHIIDDGKLKTSEILAKCKKNFDVYSWYDDAQLDKDFPPVTSDRYFKKNIEADEEYKNKSANDLDKMGVKGITLRERLLMELAYFDETGKHLDEINITLCGGSRSSGGDVPSVHWDVGNRKLYVYSCSAGYASDSLGARAVVSNS